MLVGLITDMKCTRVERLVSSVAASSSSCKRRRDRSFPTSCKTPSQSLRVASQDAHQAVSRVAVLQTDLKLSPPCHTDQKPQLPGRKVPRCGGAKERDTFARCSSKRLPLGGKRIRARHEQGLQSPRPSDTSSAMQKPSRRRRIQIRRESQMPKRRGPSTSRG